VTVNNIDGSKDKLAWFYLPLDHNIKIRLKEKYKSTKGRQ
jgi:hypothetical protein